MISAMLTLGGISALALRCCYGRIADTLKTGTVCRRSLISYFPKHNVPSAVMAGADLMPRPSLKAHPSIFVHRAARL